ncbi:unnamed protein product [Diatraea saccharalis]|uniref:LITAF domain-containing protein n=1 Tax=Diatraea saccharalis TaxID=40085 RepID=A0A9N9R7I1_9NEOP|nr:unnamed protein product [Diatraea saccharalis]
MQPNREQPPPYTEQPPTMVHHPPTMVQPTIVQPTVIQPVPVMYPVQTVTVTSTGLIGSDPTLMTCPSCLNQIVTRVDRSPSCRTHVMAVLCLLLFWPCTCLPYCVDSCNNADHYCPHCNTYIGSYKF